MTKIGRMMLSVSIASVAIPSADASTNNFQPAGGQVIKSGFCTGSETCATADVNGDGAADLITFDRVNGWVGVSLATLGRQVFGETTLWATDFCRLGMICLVGNFNGDRGGYRGGYPRRVLNIMDVVAIDPRAGTVRIGISNGRDRFTVSTYHGTVPCRADEVCRVGDHDGDGRDDFFAFVRSARPVEEGRVYVTHTAATGGPGLARELVHEYFCIRDEVCEVADFDGNFKPDLVAMRRPGPVFVTLAKSDGTYGAPGSGVWRDDFCGPEPVQCTVGNFNGDNSADLIRFDRRDYGDIRYPVSTALTTFTAEYRTTLAFFGEPVIRAENLCTEWETCATGDFDGDGKSDLIVFTRDSRPYPEQGEVRVAWSHFLEQKNWQIRMDRLLIDRADEGVPHEEPYLVVIGFRARLGVRGSTQINLSSLRNIRELTGSTSVRTVPLGMGLVSFPGVTLWPFNDSAYDFAGIHRSECPCKPEVMGAVVIAMESDATPFDTIRSTVTEHMVPVLRTALQNTVETFNPLGLFNTSSLASQVNSGLSLNFGQALGLWLSSAGDPDDVVGVNVLAFVSVDEDTPGWILGLPYTSETRQIIRDDLTSYSATVNIKVMPLRQYLWITSPLVFQNDRARYRVETRLAVAP